MIVFVLSISIDQNRDIKSTSNLLLFTDKIFMKYGDKTFKINY